MSERSEYLWEQSLPDGTAQRCRFCHYWDRNDNECSAIEVEYDDADSNIEQQQISVSVTGKCNVRELDIAVKVKTAPDFYCAKFVR